MAMARGMPVAVPLSNTPSTGHRRGDLIQCYGLLAPIDWVLARGPIGLIWSFSALPGMLCLGPTRPWLGRDGQTRECGPPMRLNSTATLLGRTAVVPLRLRTAWSTARAN